MGSVLVAGWFATLAPSITHADSAGTTVCAAEEYSWVGPAALASGASFDSGINIPAQLGTQLSVTAVDAASSPVSAGLVVSVGGTAAVAGAGIDGGDIVVTNTGPDLTQVLSAGITVNRCSQVASEAPPTVAPTTSTTAEAQPSVPTGTFVLPTTGKASATVAYAATSSFGLGVLLLVLSRRRRLLL